MPLQLLCQLELFHLDNLTKRTSAACLKKEFDTLLTVQVETAILSKFNLLKINSQTNGGFYPPKYAAEFEQKFYPNSLRKYENPRLPIDYAKPIASAKARRMSKTALEFSDPYLES